MPIFVLASTTSASATTFVELYGEDLDRELGTTDRTQRFTTARRKAAINDAQTEFIERTDCLVLETILSVADDFNAAGEADLETDVIDVMRVANAGPSLKMVDANANVRYVEGAKDFPQIDPPLRNRNTPGWRAYPAGTPNGWYLRRDGGAWKFGLNPIPEIPDGETWSVLLPCVVRAGVMSSDADQPFTVAGGVSPGSLTPWHPALVHYAAYLLEKYRKDPQRSGVQLQLYEGYVQRYLKQDRPKSGPAIQLATDYRARAHKTFRRMSVDADTLT